MMAKRDINIRKLSLNSSSYGKMMALEIACKHSTHCPYYDSVDDCDKDTPCWQCRLIRYLEIAGEEIS